MPAPLLDRFQDRSPEDGREQAPPVSFHMERTSPDLLSPRLSAPGSVAGSRTTLNASFSPSIPPLAKSSAYFWARALRTQPAMPRRWWLCWLVPVQRSLGCTGPAEMRKRHVEDCGRPGFGAL